MFWSPNLYSSILLNIPSVSIVMDYMFESFTIKTFSLSHHSFLIHHSSPFSFFFSPPLPFFFSLCIFSHFFNFLQLFLSSFFYFVSPLALFLLFLSSLNFLIHCLHSTFFFPSFFSWSSSIFLFILSSFINFLIFDHLLYQFYHLLISSNHFQNISL